MITHELVQGSPEWHAYRAQHFNAGDAAAMLGCSKYQSRTDLLHALHTGIRPEPTPEQQALFDRGHAIEAAKRPLAQTIIGEELYPVTGSEGELSASFDGLTMLEDTAWECKSLNADLRAALPNPGPDGNDAGNLPKMYRVQMEQQLLVSGAAKVLFTASNGQDDDRHCWYYPDFALREEIIAGWKQFAVDLASYAPVEVLPAAVAAPTLNLPAVSIQVKGSLALVDNLAVFGTELKAFVAKIPQKPTTDQEFADCKAAIGKLKEAQDALDAAEASALAQIASFDEMQRTKAMYWELARTTRLAVEKLVAAREQSIRTEAVQKGKDDFQAHIDALNAQLGRPYMPRVDADFAGAIRSKRTMASLHNAIATELARVKIEASRIAGGIQVNLNFLREHAKDHTFLFSDVAAIVLKPHDDLQLLVKSRIAEHQAEQARKEEETRERIRAEEQAKAEREARDKIAAEQRAQEEQRRRDEENAAAAKTMATLAESREAEALPAELQQALENVATDVIADMAVARAADTSKPAANVVPLGTRAPKAPATPPTLKLGQIAERLGFALTADFVKQLGFEPAAKEKGAILFHEHQYPQICEALVAHVRTAQAKYAEAA